MEVHTNMAPLNLLKSLLKQESLDLNFELGLSGEILQTGRQQIPGGWSNETEKTLTDRFQIAFRNFQELLA